MPQDTVSALATGAQIVCLLNTVAGCSVDPLDPVVLSVGMFRSGDVFNIIPDSAVIKGTIRTFDQATRMRVWGRLDEVCNGVCQAIGATYTVEKTFGYPPVINNSEVAAIVAAVAAVHDARQSGAVQPVAMAESAWRRQGREGLLR